MTDHLRRISLSVDEPDPGTFHWVLMESFEDASIWTELRASEDSFATYQEALHNGYEVLKDIGEPISGPRATGEDESASPVG